MKKLFFILLFSYIVSSLIAKKKLAPTFHQERPDIMFKGITFVGDKYCPEVDYEDPLADLSLYRLASTGANWVAIVVTEYQDYLNSTNIHPLYNSERLKNDYYTYKTESILGLRKIINYAHDLGLKVLLKPHIDLSREKNYSVIWRGDIGKNFTSQKQWDEWFASYTIFISKYAQLAEILKVEMFSVSCELINTSKMELHWRRVIRSIKKVYSGLLIDSANHDGEEYEKKWWDELDYIGVDAYYLPIQSPLLMKQQYSIEKDLNDTLYKLKILSEKFQKPVIITEIGFCSGNCTINQRDSAPSFTDHYIQAYFYETFIKIFTKHQFVKGFFWWAWNSDPYYGNSEDNCISPQHKQAEYVLRRYYGGNSSQVEYFPNQKPKCLCTI
jgi:hypothetical protein